VDFAREDKITRVIVGRAHFTLMKRLLGRSIADRIIAAAGDFDAELVGRQNTKEWR